VTSTHSDDGARGRGPAPAPMRFTPELPRAQATHRARVAALYDGPAPDTVIAIAGRNYGSSHGLHGTNEIDMLKQPAEWLDDVLSDMAGEAELLADPVTFRPMVIELDPLGVHFIDALLGADTCFHHGQVWGDELACDVADLQMHELSKSELLADALELARLAVEASQGHILVTTPVLSCPINTGINVFGERLLEAMVTRPEAAHHALRIITDVIRYCLRAFAQVIPQEIRQTSVACSRYAPPGFGQIDGCSTQLVSAAHYREFFAHLDAELLREWPQGGMIHLCGAHEQHIPTWRAMPELRSMQTNDRASEDLEALFHGLRDDQILYISPTETMSVDRIIEITGGRRLVLQWPLEEPIPVD